MATSAGAAKGGFATSVHHPERCFPFWQELPWIDRQSRNPRGCGSFLPSHSPLTCSSHPLYSHQWAAGFGTGREQPLSLGSGFTLQEQEVKGIYSRQTLFKGSRFHLGNYTRCSKAKLYWLRDRVRPQYITEVLSSEWAESLCLTLVLGCSG